MKHYLTLWLLLFSCMVYSQHYTMEGSVLDASTNEPLAFVNILVNNSQNGGMTDIDGYFKVSHHEPVGSLKLSYVGYEPVQLEVAGQQKVIVKMVKRTIELSQVIVVAGESPAYRIIRNVIANEKANNPDHIKSYSYTSYDKMIFTLEKDSAKASNAKEVDSSELRVTEMMNTQHLFMLESVAEHRFKYPSTHHDKIIASKVSGLKDPLFIFLLSQSQPTSFYRQTIDLAGKNYLNPVSEGFERLYSFIVADTILSMNPVDTTFIISFKPIEGRNFDGLEGLLYVSNNGWAITNVIAGPSGKQDAFSIRIQQKYELIDGKQWFPVQLNTDIAFNNFDLKQSKPVGMGKSYRKDIKLEPVIARGELDNIVVEIEPGASNRDSDYWDLYRNDTLNALEAKTYRVIDSIGKARNFSAMARLMSSIVVGRLPVGLIDIDLNKLFRYNAHEKLYLGLGLYTNNKLSRLFSFGGYAGYGFGDQTVKYGTSARLNLMKYDALWVNIGYSDDIEESAGTRFFDDGLRHFNAFSPRSFYIERMDHAVSIEASTHFRVSRYINAAIGVRKATKQALYSYSFQQQVGDVPVLKDKHDFGYISAGLRFAYKEKFIRNQEEQISLGTTFPVFWLQYTASRVGFLSGDVDYNRLDARMTYSFYSRLAGKTSIVLAGGLVDNEAPLSELVNGNGSAGKAFSFHAPGSFTTMGPSEFINDRYAAIFLTHNFGKLLMKTRLFNPDISVALNSGIGKLVNSGAHHLVKFKTMEKGYHEAGVIINNIIKSNFSGVGVAAFYRMGPNGHDRASENLMLRLTITYSL